MDSLIQSCQKRVQSLSCPQCRKPFAGDSSDVQRLYPEYDDREGMNFRATMADMINSINSKLEEMDVESHVTRRDDAGDLLAADVDNHCQVRVKQSPYVNLVVLTTASRQFK